MCHTDWRMKFIHQIAFKIEGNTTEPWNICHYDLHFIMRSKVIIAKYYVWLSNSLQDMRQSHWTVKYFTLTYNKLLLSFWGQRLCHTDSLPLSLMFIHQILFIIYTDFLAQTMVVIHQRVFVQDIRQKSLDREICHFDLHFFGVKDCATLTQYPNVWQSSIK